MNRPLLAIVCLGLGLAGGVYAVPRLTGQPPAVPGAPVALPGREAQSLAPVVKRVLPGVVCIESKGRAKHVAGEDTDPGFGSGVLIDASGVILTNNHVVNDLDAVDVTLTDGRKFTTADIRRDPKSDIALIKIETKEPLPFLEFGDSDQMEVGDRVLAVGAPFGLTGSVSSGIVSARGRTNLKINNSEDFIQTDAAMNPGSSGGALVNLDGKLVGLTAAIKTRTGGFQGIGLAVSSNLAKKVGADLLKNGGAPRRPVFGIAVRDLDEESAKRAGARTLSGVVVTRVADDSPAAKAGVLSGDVITKINGETVRGAQDVPRITSGLAANQVVEVFLWRDGKFYVGKVRTEEAQQVLKPDPAPAAMPPAVPLPAGTSANTLGLSLSELTADAAKRNGFPAGTKGVLVTDVKRNSPAEQAGLARGSVVLKVDKAAVTSPATLDQALQAASAEKGALLQVLRANGDVDFVVLKVK